MAELVFAKDDDQSERGKDILGPSGCQEDIAKYAEIGRQSGKIDRINVKTCFHYCKLCTFQLNCKHGFLY